MIKSVDRKIHLKKNSFYGITECYEPLTYSPNIAIATHAQWRRALYLLLRHRG